MFGGGRVSLKASAADCCWLGRGGVGGLVENGGVGDALTVTTTPFVVGLVAQLQKPRVGVRASIPGGGMRAEGSPGGGRA